MLRRNLSPESNFISSLGKGTDMKARLLASVIGGVVCLFLVAGSAVAPGGELVAAEYGAGNHRVDVTPQVRSFVHDGMLRFDVSDQNLGVDPARNHIKELF